MALLHLHAPNSYPLGPLGEHIEAAIPIPMYRRQETERSGCRAASGQPRPKAGVFFHSFLTGAGREWDDNDDYQ